MQADTAFPKMIIFSKVQILSLATNMLFVFLEAMGSLGSYLSKHDTQVWKTIAGQSFFFQVIVKIYKKVQLTTPLLKGFSWRQPLTSVWRSISHFDTQNIKKMCTQNLIKLIIPRCPINGIYLDHWGFQCPLTFCSYVSFSTNPQYWSWWEALKLKT